MVRVLTWVKDKNEIREVSELKPCYTCAHRTYERGSFCSRPREKVYNIITGELMEEFVRKVHDERYSSSPLDCGLEGRFWKSI